MTQDEARRRAIISGVGEVLRFRERNGGHLHHRNCIHNLPPEEQVRLRGRTPDWWVTIIGPLPEQITPDQWQTEPPAAVPVVLSGGMDSKPPATPETEKETP